MKPVATNARRFEHHHDHRDPLSLAVAAVANWLTDLRLDLQITHTPKRTT